MSLETLAGKLQAQGTPATVSLAVLEGAGLTASADLDTLIAGAFGWSAGTPITLAAPVTVGTATDTSLTVTGTLTAFKTTALATVVFSATGNAVSFTVALPLGSWAFKNSFPTMVGYPFDTVTLTGSSFVFASAPGPYTYGTEAIALEPGLNFAGDTPFPAELEALLALLGASPATPLLLRGPVDPTVITKQLTKPDLRLEAPLLRGPLPKLGFLQLVDAELVIAATTQDTQSGKTQYTAAGLATKLDFGEGEPVLDCRITVRRASGQIDLLLAPDPKAPQPTLAALFTAMGGRSWYDVVPAPLQGLFTAFALQGLSSSIQVVKGTPSISSIGMAIGTSTTWTPFDGLDIGALTFGWTIDDPLGDAAVGATFTGEAQFLKSVFPGVFYVGITSDLAISAEYVGDAKLSTLLAGGSATSLTAADHPIDFDLESVSVDFDVPRKAFSLSAAASATIDVFGDGTINLESITVAFAKAPSTISAGLNAIVMIADTPLFFDATYDNGNWHFAGGLVPGTSLDLGALVGQLCTGLSLPTDFVPDDLKLKPLQMSLDVPSGSTPASWTLDAGVQWVFSAGALQDMELDAAVDLAYDGGTKAYSGTLSGEAKLPLPFGTIDVVLAYAFKPGSKSLMVEWKGFAKATYSFEDDTIVFVLEVRSLGDMIAEIVRVVEDDPDFELPAPWSLLNQIVLKDFTVTWRLKPKAGESAIELTYDMTGNEIDLGFVTIRSLSLSTVNGKVMVGLDLKFLGQTDYAEQKWPAQDPAPAPGGENAKFELDLLALGQHVTVVGLDKETSVDGAIALLESFTPPTGATVPVSASPAKGQPVYAPDSSWLVGTRFKVLVDNSVKPSTALLDLEAVFNDPQLYGLKITLGGAKAGIFGGLSFEILYRKISDTVGVYEIELTLPDWARHLEFGEVSVTLPIVGVDVYTNGDFRIDFGFPANMDFSRSFAIQAFPFTGAGGFYFGVLSSATATSLPQTTKGHFDPVIVFGLGLQIGLGKSIDEGIFTAQLTVSVFGIVEGIVAPWHANSASPPSLEAGGAGGAELAALGAGSPSPFNDEFYYWLQGTIGIVGKIVGAVNFAIISASVSITVQAFVQMTIEAHRAIPIHLEAGVDVEITLKINLWLFTINIHLSFSLTVKADFVIGSRTTAPWDESSALEAAAHPAALLAAAKAVPLVERSFSALAVEDKLPLTLIAAPHLTLADWTTGSPSAAYVVSLFVSGPIGQPAAPDPSRPAASDPSKPTKAAPSDFEVLARETLLWTITNFGTAAASSLTPAEAAAGDVSAAQIAAALAHFTAEGPPPLAYSDISAFLGAHFAVTVQPPNADMDGAVGIPMVPDLVLGVPAWNGLPAETIDFSTAGWCTPAYLDALQAILEKLAVQLETPLQQGANASAQARPGAATPQSLATFVFEDFFALMSRHLLQAAADSFAKFPWLLDGTESLTSIVIAFSLDNAITAAQVGSANATLALTAGRPLVLNGVTRQVKTGESLNAIAAGYPGASPQQLATANAGLEGLLATGVSITVGSAPPHLITGRDTLTSIANATGASFAEVVAVIAPLTDVLVPLAIIAVPQFTHTTVAGDQLVSVAAAYGVTVEQLATDNSAVTSLFAVPAVVPPATEAVPVYAVVPGLTVVTAQQLIDVLAKANVYANLAGIATRFLLNGLRLPITADITLPPGSPYVGAADAGMQALIGQQVSLPTLTATDSYELTLTAGAGGTWFTLPGGPVVLPIDNSAPAGRTGQIDWINEVLAAAGSALIPKVTAIEALPDTQGVARRIVLSHAIPVQAAAPLTLPVGATAARPTVFPLPDALLTVLADTATIEPAFSLQLAEPAPSGGGVILTPASSFGWGTLVNVTVKRPPAGAATPMAPGTYELVGTDAAGTVLLERLLQSGARPPSFQVLFAPNASVAASAGLQLDDPSTVSAFIVQANLSTATAPQGGLRALALGAELAAAPQVVRSEAVDLARLLWECSIVASGGYSLYYESAPGNPGLPEHLFDPTGTATIQLLVFDAQSSVANGIGSYVNTAVIGDAIDASRTSVMAQSEARTVAVSSASGDSLATIAGGLHLTVSELAAELATQPLLPGAVLAIAGGLYETRSGDALDALATRFATTGAAIQAANAGLAIDWTAIPAWTALALPQATFTVPASGTATLGTVATQFGLAVEALGFLNATVALLPAATLSIVDQLVDATAVLPPGIGGFTVGRTQLASDPSLPAGASDPAVYLDSTFHLLGYQVADTLGFTGGPSGLPIGPTHPVSADQLQQPVSKAPVPASDAPSVWRYEQLIPLSTNAKASGLAPVTGAAPPAIADPYAGVGAYAQPRLEWRDLFGNRARTPLTDPTLNPSGPQNMPPIRAEYTDALLGVAQWPSSSITYLVSPGSPPTIDLELRFETARYSGATTAGAAQNAARADRQTLAQAFYQLNQIHPDGTPHVAFTLASSLDGGTPHALTGTADSQVRGFVLSAWQYLDGLLGGTSAPQLDPIVARCQIPVAAANAADIFELTVDLTLARDPALVAAAARDEHGVVDATVAVSPRLGDPSSPTDTMSVAAFAEAFKTAYSAGAVTLQIGVGDSREGAAGSAQARLLWAVRTSAAPQAGAIGCEVTGPAVFWAPPPLSTTPVSRNDVPIWPFDPDGTSQPPLDPSSPELRSFTGIDLDVWARQALAAIDGFLSPAYDVPAFVLDAAGSTTYLDRLRTAKTSLADAIAGTVQGVLTTPPAPTDQPSIDDAQDKWRQQLLVTLSSAYTVDVAVQLPVTVSSATDPAYGLPALYGHLTVATPTPTRADTPTPTPIPAPPAAPPYSLSTFKVKQTAAGVDPSSHLTFLFTANDPADQASVVLDLGFQVDQIEHQIGSIAGIDGYQASTWLSFPEPLPAIPLGSGASSTIEVPVVLRAYPDAPRLTAQSSEQTLDRTNASKLLRSATQWSYVAQYAEQHAAQDVTQATAIFNVAPPSEKLLLGATKDLFPPLARLINDLPAIQGVFDADLSQLTTASGPNDAGFKRAARAVEAFTTLVEDVAQNWAPAHVTAGVGVSVPSGTEVVFTIAESRYPAPSESDPVGGSDLLVTITIDPTTPLPDGIPVPALVFDQWAGEEWLPVPTGAGFRFQNSQTQAFLSWEQARSEPGRSVVTGPVDVLGVENAQMGVQIQRNVQLVSGENRTLQPFVYRTPLVTFPSAYTPLLSVGDAIDVAAITTGTAVPRPLLAQLQSLFGAFFSAAVSGSQQTIQLQIGYRYALSSGLPADALPPIEIPIALVPSAPFTVPDDWSPGGACPAPVVADSAFVCRIVETIQAWVKANQPTAEAQLTFDLAAFSTLSSSTLPLVRLSGLVLDRSNIADL